jgi:hypothetical protein
MDEGGAIAFDAGRYRSLFRFSDSSEIRIQPPHFEYRL